MNVRMVVKLSTTFTFQVDILGKRGSADKKFENPHSLVVIVEVQTDYYILLQNTFPYPKYLFRAHTLHRTPGSADWVTMNDWNVKQEHCICGNNTVSIRLTLSMTTRDGAQGTNNLGKRYRFLHNKCPWVTR